MNENKTVEETKTEATEAAAEKNTDVEELKARVAQLEADNAKLKKANNDVSSDAAEWKRKYRDNLTEQARKDEEAAEKAKADKAELENLRREKTVATYTANYLSLGYDKDSATKAAEALASNDTASLFEIQKTHQDKATAALKNEMLNKQPDLSKGKPVESDQIEDAFFAAVKRGAGLA